MARIRTIKPEFWKSEALSALPEPTHMLAAQLLNYVDDEGYFNANPALIKAECSPLREPSVSIPTSLMHLSTIGYCRFGTTGDGRRYGQIVSFGQHQTINRATPSKISGLSIVWDESVIAHGVLTEDSLLEGKGREQGKEQGTGKVAVAPVLELNGHSNTRKPEFNPDTIPGLDLIAWRRFIAYRVEIRKPYKPISLPSAAKELASYGADQAAVVEQTIAKGWTGLFALKIERGGSQEQAFATARKQFLGGASG